jgi:hypothetical protein
MSNKPPKFKEFVRIEQELLTARLDAARAAIHHAGEKGRALEEAARRLIRSFLPAEYGLSSGFVAYQDPNGVIRLSKHRCEIRCHLRTDVNELIRSVPDTD